MSRSPGIHSFVILVAMVSVVGLLLLSWKPNPQQSNMNKTESIDSDPSPTEIMESESTPTASQPSLYIFDYVDANGVYQDGPTFDTEDKVGVAESTSNALPSRTTDFLAIGADNASREQFVANVGITLNDLDRKWNVAICDHGTVEGKTRLSVVSDVGVDGEINDSGMAYDGLLVEATVHEIWELSDTGGPPALLDRSLTLFDGLATHSESPVTLPTDFSTIVHGDGIDDMGENP